MPGRLACSITLVALALAPSPCWAQDFRVETDVFVDDNPEPLAQYLTLFHGTTIYDFLLAQPQQITVFDTVRSRFILLDTARKVKTELSTRDVEAFQQRLRERVKDRESRLFEPELAYTFNEAEQWHILKGDVVEYRARGMKPKFAEAATRYRVFADWYAQLNAMRPGNPPPYARLQLNKVLAEKQLLPEEIRRTLTVGTLPPRRSTASTQHHVNWLLSGPDLQRIRQAGDYLASFESVDLNAFFEVK